MSKLNRAKSFVGKTIVVSTFINREGQRTPQLFRVDEVVFRCTSLSGESSMYFRGHYLNNYAGNIANPEVAFVPVNSRLRYELK